MHQQRLFLILILRVCRVWLEQDCKSDVAQPPPQLKRWPAVVLKTGDLIQHTIMRLIFTPLKRIIILGTLLGDQLMQNMLNYEGAPFR